MPVRIRKMEVRDLLDAKNLDAVCWSDLWERAYGTRKSMPPRTDENILAFMHTDPEGAFIAEDDAAGKVGTCFSHVWGKTGWVGPLSVLPTAQSQGIGKELLKASLTYIEDRGCLDIGLETMTENPANLGMYLKVGLRPEGLILMLAKKLEDAELGEEPSGNVSVERLSESGFKASLTAQMKELSSGLQPGLDYSSEIELAERFSFGDTLAASSEGKVVGFAVVHTKPRREKQSIAGVKILAARPETTAIVLGPMISAAELMAADAGLDEVTISVPALARRSLDVLFSRGYSVSRSFVRLMWLGSSGIGEQDCGCNLCSWSA